MRLRERGVRVRIRSQATASRLAPVLEPTGKLSVSAPARAAGYGRTKRHARRAAPFLRWLGRNAEPLLWATVLSALALSLWFSPLTQLTRLEVVGALGEARAELYALLQTHLRQPMPLHDSPRQVERAVQALEWVQQVRWQAAGVGRARLRVVPRTPFAEIRDENGARIFADPAGFLFAPPNPNQRPTAGMIRLAQDSTRRWNGRYAEGEMRAALEILRAVSRRADVRRPRVHLSRTNGIRLYAEVQRGAETPVAVQLRFGDANALERQLATMHRLLDMPLSEWHQWEYVDISTPDAEAVKPRATSGGER